MDRGKLGIDPETACILSSEEVGQEWELYKENVRPLQGGRKLKLLNVALTANQDASVKQSLLDKRRKLIEAIEDYRGDDPLQPWIECIKWVQESFPTGGEQSGLLPIYEQCVRSLWQDKRYHNDLRYLKIWLEYAEQCNDPEVVCKFLYVNDIGTTHSLFYKKYATFLEVKHKMKAAEEILSIGIARGAQPLDKLQNARACFRARVDKASKREENEIEMEAPLRNFGTIMHEGSRHSSTSQDGRRKRPLTARNENYHFSIYVDPKVSNPCEFSLPIERANSKEIGRQDWSTLGTRAERNKENISVPSKWTAEKIPQKHSVRAATPELEVFVDEECIRESSNRRRPNNGFPLHIRRGDLQAIKRETESLKENPLMNFPKINLPR